MSSISFFNEETNFTPVQKILLRQWLRNATESENHSIDEINYIFCSDEYLWEMNRQYLSHDTYTDILTFDNSESESVLVGDIFISVDRLRENSKKFAVSFEDELHRVMVHGILHLCGYGDLTDEEEESMRNLENLYLERRPEKLRVSKK